ncbi:hypothetical protein QVD17_06740 [Tagetes erecta]|uniref:F-box associated beta-propeller type 3 domain-containing protein n=1 Tax=Tagetes erecta TaxID=13708 RepID=A0AAD8LMD2_TARER|nr:hypothetical protein QVD17_06740 [Tagetes erecta]
MANSSNHYILAVKDSKCIIGKLYRSSHLPWSTTIVSLPLDITSHDFLILATLHGLLVVSNLKTSELVLWNPTTKENKVISNLETNGYYIHQSDAVGFYMDSTKDYRVLHIQRKDERIQVYTYSRRLGFWRRLYCTINKDYHKNSFVWSPGVFCNDKVYFAVEEFWVGGKNKVLFFDVNNEIFTEMPFPKNIDGVICRGNLVSVKNQLQIFISYTYPQKSVDLWELVHNKWKKVSVLTDIFHLPLYTSIGTTPISGTSIISHDGVHKLKMKAIEIQPNLLMDLTADGELIEGEVVKDISLGMSTDISISKNNFTTTAFYHRHSSMFSNNAIISGSSSIVQNSTLRTLQSGKHKLKRKVMDITPIPIFDFISNNELHDEQVLNRQIPGTSTGIAPNSGTSIISHAGIHKQKMKAIEIQPNPFIDLTADEGFIEGEVVKDISLGMPIGPITSSVILTSTKRVLQPGKHLLKSKTIDVSAMPKDDQKTIIYDECTSISIDYIDHGDQTRIKYSVTFKQLFIQ